MPALRWVFGTLWRGFEAFCSLAERFWVTFGIGLLIGMWALLLLNCIGRWTGAYSIGWTLEILGYMVAWSIFVMAGPITRWDAQIKVSVIPDKLLGEKRGAAFTHAVENFVGLVFCTYLTIHAFRFIRFVWGEVEQSSAGWDYPLWLVYCGILAGFLFCSIYYFERTVRWIRQLFLARKGKGGEPSPED